MENLGYILKSDVSILQISDEMHGNPWTFYGIRLRCMWITKHTISVDIFWGFREIPQTVYASSELPIERCFGYLLHK